MVNTRSSERVSGGVNFGVNFGVHFHVSEWAIRRAHKRLNAQPPDRAVHWMSRRLNAGHLLKSILCLWMTLWMFSACLPEPQFDLDEDGMSAAMGDCNDSAPDIHQGAQEVCDGQDNDCMQTPMTMALAMQNRQQNCAGSRKVMSPMPPTAMIAVQKTIRHPMSSVMDGTTTVMEPLMKTCRL